MQVTTGGHATALTKREYLSVTPTSLLAPISSPIWMEPDSSPAESGVPMPQMRQKVPQMLARFFLSETAVAEAVFHRLPFYWEPPDTPWPRPACTGWRMPMTIRRVRPTKSPAPGSEVLAPHPSAARWRGSAAASRARRWCTCAPLSPMTQLRAPRRGVLRAGRAQGPCGTLGPLQADRRDRLLGVSGHPVAYEASEDFMHYPVEVRNRAAGIFRMAGHMLGKRLLLFLLHHGLVVGVVDDDPQPFPRRWD